jgi:hypothetical protein
MAEDKKGLNDMKKALILGISGQDGVYMAKFLLRKGIRGYRASSGRQKIPRAFTKEYGADRVRHTYIASGTKRSFPVKGDVLVISGSYIAEYI